MAENRFVYPELNRIDPFFMKVEKQESLARAN